MTTLSAGDLAALPPIHPLAFMQGGGAVGAQMRALDWSATPLGPAEHWPQSLKTAVGILVPCGFPMQLWWGPQLTMLYNDEFTQILGDKHPWALGSPVEQVWSDVWPVTGPMAQHVLAGGDAVQGRDLQLVMTRFGYAEETFFSFSYSPVRDDSGAIAGIIVPVIETTFKVLAERRLRALRDLGALPDIRDSASVIDVAMKVLAAHPLDVPFAACYQIDEHQVATRVGLAGLDSDSPLAPPRFRLDANAPWPAAEALQLVTGLAFKQVIARFGEHALAPWFAPIEQTMVLPLRLEGWQGVLVCGVSPRRALDADYRTWFDLIAGQFGNALNHALSHEQAQQRADRLAELDHAKTVFFSNISHEFRTPLTLIQAAVNELTALPQAEQATEPLDMLVRNQQRLLKLVNNLLDFSRIEGGHLNVQREAVDLARFTAELAESFRSLMEQGGLILLVDCPPLDQPVWIDRGLWETIVLNLLSNAFKFTLAGTVSVRLHVDGAGIKLQVADTGVGIALDQQTLLFQRFQRLEGRGGRSFEGSGIGLSMVHELVQLLEGQIDVVSQPGVGTTFNVHMPWGAASEAPPPRAEVANVQARRAYVDEAAQWLDQGMLEAEPEPTLTGAAGADLILVVDDNLDFRRWLVRLLASSGYTVMAASNGAEALRIARATPPRLVLSDVMMPDMDGFALLAAMRAEPALALAPFLLLSAQAGEEARADGLLKGADDYLVKPFSAQQLLIRVRGKLLQAYARHGAAEALRQSEQRFREVADAAPVMIWVSDEAGLRTWCNRPWLAFTGRTLIQEVGHGWAEGVHPDDVSRCLAVYARAIKQREPFRMDYRLRRADGEYRVIEDHGVPHITGDDRFVGFIGSCVDVTRTRMSEEAQRRLNETLEVRVQARTEELAASYRSLLTQIQERERVETTLRQMQRLEAVGQLTAGFAHDFNNLLTVVLANARLLDRVITEDPGKRRVEMIRTAAERGARLVAQLLAFARRQKLEPHVVNLNETLAGMADLLQSTLGGMNQLELAFSDDLAPALVDITQLELVVLNLAINARDAMPNGGALRISTNNVSINTDFSAQMALAVGEYVRLAVSDTGTGMPPEVVARAFEPFFTTKEVGKGSGLGLAQVYGFARQSGGTVTIDTSPGRGTTVSVFLPATQQAESGDRAINVLPGSGANLTGQQRVLVVDDDEDVRESTVAVLQDQGYTVVQTGDCTVALELIATNDDIDVLVADFAMPVMNGAELARRARILQPDLPVLFVTGYADQVLLADFSADQIIQKPFQPQDLAARISRLLGHHRARLASR